MRLLGSIAKRKTAFFGNICRGSRGTDIMAILEGSIDGVRPRGAQRREWADNVKE